jgi:molybdopterin-guanine dinucleotide biosynthesis protein B/molybdopterin-guanine dinucleotide biosynthesis protein
VKINSLQAIDIKGKQMAGTGKINNSAGKRDFSVAILAGGESSRMGKNKALEILGGKTVIAHVIDSLRPLTNDMFIVAGDVAAYEGFGLPICADHYDFRASLVGIYSAIASSREERCLVVACDMPFVEPALARLLASLSAGYDAVVPVSPRGWEPLLAVYSKSCLKAMRERIKSGDLAIHHVLDNLKVRYVELAEMAVCCDPALVFININNVVELEKANLLVPRVRKFRRQTGSAAGKNGSPPLVCFVGKKNSGKTTFLEKLVRELISRGLTVAYIKHDVHGFEMDREGTDTWRLTQAGAHSVMISSPFAMASLEKVGEEKNLDELAKRVDGSADIIVVEGFKCAGADKLEVSRSARSDSLACSEDELLGIISDREEAASGLPVFAIDDISGVADFLADHYEFDAGRKDGEIGF